MCSANNILVLWFFEKRHPPKNLVLAPGASIRINTVFTISGCLETVNEEVTVAAPLLLPESSSIQVANIVTWNTGCEAEHQMRVCMTEYDTIMICQIVPRLVGSDTVVKVCLNSNLFIFRWWECNNLIYSWQLWNKDMTKNWQKL